MNDYQRILSNLRSAEDLVPFMYSEGYVESTKLLRDGDDISSVVDIVDGKNIVSTCSGGKTYIRATFGHSGLILEKINYGKYVKYDGPYKIFCITHTSPFGLGAVNYNRAFNILNVPERCSNKGIMLYINIEEARQSGIEFWSQVGDMYKNKVFCFDINMRFSFFKIEYATCYNSHESLLQSHGNLINLMKTFMGNGKDDIEKTKLALEHVSRLIVQDDEDDEDDDDVLDEFSEMKL